MDDELEQMRASLEAEIAEAWEADVRATGAAVGLCAIPGVLPAGRRCIVHVRAMPTPVGLRVSFMVNVPDPEERGRPPQSVFWMLLDPRNALHVARAVARELSGGEPADDQD